MTPDALALLDAHLRTALATVTGETRRLFHGRGRCYAELEHVTVDWLGGVVLVSLFREPEPDALNALRSLLQGLIGSPAWVASGAASLVLQHRELPGCPWEWLHGDASGLHVITEDGLRYQLDLGRAQNTGLFLDMRLGRQWLREHCQDARVLNLFAYTCGFSVAALEGGAQKVVNLDMAKSALARGRENHRLNGHDLGKVEFLGHDLFKSWGRLVRSGPFERIVIDPPSFQRGSFVLTNDYHKVLRRVPELLVPGGVVMACMNEPSLPSQYLIDLMAEHAPGLTFVERLANPAEFPDADPEGGLKVLLFSA